MGASAGVDALLLVLGMGLAALLVLSACLARELQPARPRLPDADQPPAGLGRLVPVGRQVDTEARRGTYALDLWLRARRARP